MEAPVTGTVTSLSSLFSAEEAENASKRVHEAIAERETELDKLRDFISDNTSLINLVQKLPEELHHDIMVPFGKAAFFPGRLNHTNEFLVFLGEGYYAERTAKQTIDILKRREKALETQLESLKAVMKDLKAEASFFESTAAEAAEGLVEIREELVEEIPAESMSRTGRFLALIGHGVEQGQTSQEPPHSEVGESKIVGDNDEYAYIMSRMDELEKEELAAESLNDCHEDEYADMMARVDEHQKKELAAEKIIGNHETVRKKADSYIQIDPYGVQHSLDLGHRSSEGHISNVVEESKDELTSGKKLSSKVTFEQDSADKFSTEHMESVKLTSLSEVSERSPSVKRVTFGNSTENSSRLSEMKTNVQAESASKNEAFTGSAFTGSIVEHTNNLNVNQREPAASSKSSTLETTKRVSRFKMQRR